MSEEMSALKPIHFRPKNGVRIVVWTTFALILLALPIFFKASFALTLLCLIGIAAIACMSYNMLLGQAGMLSFGHAVYTGFGAFVAIHAMNKITAGAMIPMGSFRSWAVSPHLHSGRCLASSPREKRAHRFR
jgi:ABC-type branched-subunit amino acid transport system permease subunit